MKEQHIIALGVAVTVCFLLTAAAVPAAKVEVTPAGTFPIVKEPVTLNVLMRTNAFVEDFATNEFTKWYEEKTNVKIDWQVLPQTGAEDKVNLMLATGDLPDVIMTFRLTSTQLMLYGAQGLFLPLNDMIEKYGVETKRVFEETGWLEKVITSPDGNIYGLPSINECYHCFYSQKLWINQPWLDTLDLEMPQTTEEFYQVLKAFKEQDPNGNGKADEIPLAGALETTGWMTFLDGFLMNAFIYTHKFNDKINEYFILDDERKIDIVVNKPEWKEGLQYLHRLYKEGLISDLTFTQTKKQLKQMGENPDIEILGAAVAGAHGNFVQPYSESGRWKQYTAVPPLEGPNGLRVTGYKPFAIHEGPGRFVITSACENPEVAFRWAEGMYELETTLRSIAGVLGRDWDWAEKDEIGINGKPAIWKRHLKFGQLQNANWSQAGISYRPNHLRLGEVAGKAEDNLELILYRETNEKYEPYGRPLEKLIPPMTFTEDQSMELAEMGTTIQNYIREMLARFVTGDVDIETGWDEYVATLDSMGLSRYIEIHQEAYNTMWAE
ncbi:MAG: extracellular solute-binding protein [bacterium]|nr:extracellular solute-binding protein [bacterium]